VLFAILLLLSSQAASCDNVEVCRAQALIAHAKGDFESFHDYAWAAYRKAKPNDPELMLLIARAQSLSGRPGDALVMLERVATHGTLPADIASDPEFARVRALPRWSDVSSRLLATPAAVAEKPAAPPTPAPAPRTPVPAKPEPSKPPLTAAEPPAPPKPAPKPPRPAEPVRPAEEPKVEAPKPDPKAKPAEPTATTPVRTPGAPLKFTTPLTPTALAYDRVSKRYIIGDRRARRIAVVDENTGHVSTLVGALGGLGDVEGIAIDAQQGDLWVITSSDDGVSLSKMQLISGRVLSTVKVREVDARVVALSFVPGSGLVAADGEGILWAVRPNGRAEKLAALEYVPTSIGADGRGRLYVSAGGPRLARFAMAPFRRVGTVEAGNGPAPGGPFVVVADRLETIADAGEGYELRSVIVK
jgi:hypothetical protein